MTIDRSPEFLFNTSDLYVRGVIDKFENSFNIRR